MKIALSCDHRGTHLYDSLCEVIRKHGHSLIQVPTCVTPQSDYPDLAWHTGRAVADGAADRGILICGSGIGMSIAANKVPGIRAALVHDDITAEVSRRHNDANVLCLSADMLGHRLIEKIIDIWLKTEFEGGRHARRNAKITAIESNQDPATVNGSPNHAAAPDAQRAG